MRRQRTDSPFWQKDTALADMFGAPSWVQIHVASFTQSEVLLLELCGNETLGHFFGTGVPQFTIAQKDLAAGNFERVRMTVSAS